MQPPFDLNVMRMRTARAPQELLAEATAARLLSKTRKDQISKGGLSHRLSSMFASLTEAASGILKSQTPGRAT